MIATIVVGQIARAATKSVRQMAEGWLHFKAARGASAEANRTGQPLMLVKEVLVVSEEELRQLEEFPPFLRAMERARALRAANALTSCRVCGSYQLCGDEGASGHA